MLSGDQFGGPGAANNEGGDAHAESAVPSWIYELRGLGRSCRKRELRFDLPLVRSRFRIGLLGGWSIGAVGLTCRWRVVVGAFYRMGDTCCATATGYFETVT